MSYLDQPRINFAGKFQASPSTINNTPNNYNPAAYNEGSLKPLDIELFWEPKGDSIFDLINCQVTTVEAPGIQTDPIVGTSVLAVYTGAPPKLVDLDPMQQNVSEVWGMTVMIGTFGGAYVSGTFAATAYNGVWQNSQGQNSPRNSASGAAVYQSTLTNLTWNTAGSAVLQALFNASPNRLSIRMVVSGHNNAPQFYAFTPTTFQAMAAQGVSPEVLAKIVSLQEYVMNVDSTGKPKPPVRGFIPTLQYVNYLLDQLLGPSTGQPSDPRTTILSVAKQPYQPWINYSTGQPLPPDQQPLPGSFNYGKLVGSVGPCLDDEPTFAVPARTLAPPSTETTPAAWFAQAELDLGSTPPSLTLDLANSLPIQMPGGPLWQAMLGTLSLAYYTVSGGSPTYTTFVPSIDYTDPAFIDQRSGMLVVTDFGAVDPTTLANLPLALQSTTLVNGKPVTQTLISENPEGISMRADRFVFRMNPGMQTTPTFPRGETNTIEIYVRKFGGVGGTSGLKIGFNVLDPQQAVTYTLGTMGTGGTNGINAGNTSTPQGKLLFASSVVTVAEGKAAVLITGTDPGNPRGYIDGQVYFAKYAFNPPVTGYYQDPDDVISAQIYTQTPITGTPTWLNGIGDILRQYGMLYPIMGRFQLWTYGGVVENNLKIAGVLGLDATLPLHMPATRDLSSIRCNLILGWFSAGMPYGPIGPVGGPGTSWNNLSAVSGWGPMTSLVIRSGDIIDAIQPIYGSNSAPIQGGPRGTPTTIDLKDDAIVSMTGFTGTYFGLTQVAQITFTTARGKTYGPFGTMRNVYGPTPFTLPAPAGGAIWSFFGTTVVHTDGTTYIASLGGNVQAPPQPPAQ
jgi:hypothetical protein